MAGWVPAYSTAGSAVCAGGKPASEAEVEARDCGGGCAVRCRDESPVAGGVDCSPSTTSFGLADALAPCGRTTELAWCPALGDTGAAVTAPGVLAESEAPADAGWLAVCVV